MEAAIKVRTSHPPVGLWRLCGGFLLMVWGGTRGIARVPRTHTTIHICSIYMGETSVRACAVPVCARLTRYRWTGAHSGGSRQEQDEKVGALEGALLEKRAAAEAQGSLVAELEGLLQAKDASLEVIRGIGTIPYLTRATKVIQHPPSLLTHTRTNKQKHTQSLHAETAASAQQLRQLQAALSAKESECAAGGRRVEDLEAQVGLLRRGREEDAEERGALRAEVGRLRGEAAAAAARAREEVRGGWGVE